MRPIVLIGSPGSGKGTQGRKLSEYFDIPHISTGDMLRDQVQRQTVIGFCVKETLDKGLLVPDELISTMLQTRLKNEDCLNGYILDGFPRTVEQARWYYAHYDQPTVLVLDVPREEVLRRIAARKDGRADDKSADIVAGRMQEYEQFTAPLIGYYEREANFHRVDATQGIDGTFDWIKNLLMSKDVIAYG
jgi:adenylate kinase